MLQITREGVSLSIDETEGGRAVSWHVDGLELLGAHSDHPINYGMYPMAPWAGRIRNNSLSMNGKSHAFPENLSPWAIHGLVVSAPFAVVAHEQHRLVLEFRLTEPWPMPAIVRCEWFLDDGGLTTALEIETCGADFPAVVGWHPWFRRHVGGVSGTWATDCTRLLDRGDDALPTGGSRDLASAHGPFDDQLTGGHHASLRWPGVLSLQIENSSPWFVVYDATANFICIEPQSGPVDGLNPISDLPTMVTSAKPLALRTHWRIIRERPGD